MAQTWPLSSTEEYVPASMPMISGNANSRMEDTPKMNRQTRVISVVSVVLMVRDSVVRKKN